MSTVQEIINYADRKFPNTETAANKVSDLNDIQREIFKQMNDIEIYELATVAGQAIYQLPSNSSIDLVITVKIAASPTVTDETEFVNCDYAGLNDELEGYKYYNATDGMIGIYPIPDTSGLSIRLFYYKRPALLSADNLTAVPELNTDYHSILKYGLIQSLASSGRNPDTEIADYYQRKYDEVMAQIQRDRMEKKINTPERKQKANRWWY